MEPADVMSLALLEAKSQGIKIRCVADERDRPVKIISMLTGDDSNRSARRIRELPNAVKQNLFNCKFEGERRRETPVATPSDLVSVILALPNPGSKYPLLTQFRDHCSNHNVVRHCVCDPPPCDC